MKNLPRLLPRVFLSGICMFAVATAGQSADSTRADTEAPAAQPANTLAAGGIVPPVVFEDIPDKPVSGEERAAVLRDLQLVYGHIRQFETVPIQPRVMKAGGKELAVSKMLNFTGEGRYFPSQHLDTFGFLAGDPEQGQLVIPSGLMARYRKALDLMATHKEAFDRLAVFLPASHDYAKAWSGLAPSDLIWTPESDDLPAARKEDLARELKSARFVLRMPSILEFHSSGDNPREFSKEFGWPELPANALVGRTLLLDQGNIPKRYEAIVYTGGKWRIVVVPSAE